MNTLRASASTEPGKLASACVHLLEETGEDVLITSVGETASYVVIKALCIATDFAEDVGLDLTFTVDFFVDSDPVTGRTYSVTEYTVHGISAGRMAA